MYKLESFTINPAAPLTQEIYTNKTMRQAAEIAVSYVLDEYESEQIAKGIYDEVDPDDWIVGYIPETFTISVTNKSGTVCLTDNLQEWSQCLHENDFSLL